ncbi:hypothetical protein [Vibrio owensii]|uniref:hypothetical protein n=1 Tax=Vibrio owensii TaxID=696485 RepID=UPI002FF1AA1E
MLTFSFFFKSIPNIIKYNFKYYKKLKEIECSKKWSEQEWRDYQLASINKNLKINGLKMIDSLVEMDKIPITNKDYYQSRISKYKQSGNIYHAKTGGSTGKPFEMFKSKNDILYEHAFLDNILSSYGVNVFGLYRSMRIRGEKFSGIYKRTAINKISLSSYSISNETIADYVKVINKFSPDVIFAYPSSLYNLAIHIQKYDKDILKSKSKLKLIIVSSEVLLEHQLSTIKEVFNCRVVNLYGNTEHSIFAIDSLDGNGFIHNKLYSYVEFLDNHIITTSFNDDNMPLVRYSTDDIGFLNHDGSFKLDGRAQDIALGKSGTQYPVTGIIFGQHFSFFSKIKEMQLIQKKAGELILKYYSENPLLEHEVFNVKVHIRDLSSNDLKLDLQHQSFPIEKTKVGKLAFFKKEI